MTVGRSEKYKMTKEIAGLLTFRIFSVYAIVRASVYHIALPFDGEICEGITHEFSG